MKNISITGVGSVLLCTLWAATAAQAADLPLSIQMGARCAPRASTGPEPLDAIRIIGVQDTVPKSLYGARDLLIVGAGTGRGIGLGQQFIVRRTSTFGSRTSGPRGVETAGWLRIVAANETTSIALVEFACEGIEQGDYLEPFVEPVFPDNLVHVDTTGGLDFSAPAHVLFGHSQRLTGGTGDFMVIDTGTGGGVQPGARFAVFRDVHVTGVPLAPVGEAVVVHADADTAVVRLMLTRDAVQANDLLIPRKPR
jgi:hypothetical protein